jgi:hypothetical protein
MKTLYNSMFLKTSKKTNYHCGKQMGFVKRMFHFLIVSNKIKFNKLIQQNFKLFTQLIIQILRGSPAKSYTPQTLAEVNKGV